MNKILNSQIFINPTTGRQITSTRTISRLIREGDIPVPDGLILSNTNRLVKDSLRNRKLIRERGYVLTDENRVSKFESFPVEGDEDIAFVRNTIKQNEISGLYRISYVNNGNIIQQVIYDIPTDGVNSWWNQDFLFNDWIYDSPNSLFKFFGKGQLLFTKSEDIIPQEIIQSFSEGETHCIFKHIIKLFENRIENAKNKTNKYKFGKKLRESIEDSEIYKDGLPQKDIQKICDKYSIAISIMDAARNGFIECRPEGKPYFCFKFINTKINHVEKMTISSFKDRQIVSREVFEQIKEQLIKDKLFFHFTNSTIHTCDNFYSLLENEEVEKWEKEQKIDKMEYFSDPEMSQFVRSSNHFGGCFDMVEDPFENLSSLKHIDHIKSYASWDKCKYYNIYKFPIAPKVYQKLPKYFDFKKFPGFYQIDNVCDTKVKESVKFFNNKMKLIENGIVYNSADLHFYSDLGFKFDITCGAYAFTSQDIDVSGLLEIKPPRDSSGKKLKPDAYKVWAGKQAMICTEKVIKIKGDAELASHLASVYGNDRIKLFGDEISIYTRKEVTHHRSHISSFILSYSRIQILEQLFLIPPECVKRIQLDGIYFTDCDIPVIKTFIEKPVEHRSNKGCDRYFSIFCKTWEPPEFDEQFTHRLILATGPGGTGKTHFYLNSRNLFSPVYVAPSNKLVRAKVNEYNLKNYCTLAKLLGYNCESYKGNVSVIIIDEGSMLTQKDLERILISFPHSLIIICGDIGYQLPPPKNIGKPAIFDNSWFRKQFTKNYRTQDLELLEVLNLCRKLMKLEKSKEEINSSVISKLNNRIGSDENYKLNDYIITSTHSGIKHFTDKHKSKGNKWYITKNSKTHSNGDVIIQNEQPPNSELKHAFTAHAIQGETIHSNLFIDTNRLFEPQMLYTMLSRAKEMSQIHLVSSA